LDPTRPADVVPVRTDPELRTAIEARAQSKDTTTSEVIREAIRSFSGLWVPETLSLAIWREGAEFQSVASRSGGRVGGAWSERFDVAV